MTQQAPTYHIAVDVAKDSLRVQSEHEALTLENNKRGFERLAKITRKHPDPLVVFEASGGYERELLEFLSAREIAAVLINPRRLRAFARSEGIKAKNDPIDARMILRFAKQKQPPPTRVASVVQRELADLLDRRHQLSAALAREKNRQQKAGKTLRAVAASLRRSIAMLEKEIARLEIAIREVIRSRPPLQRAFEVITSIEGVGEVTAWSLLGYLGEIDHLSRNQLAALVGVAPFDDDSGTRRGIRYIQGGRKKVRGVLYMAATSAAQHNAVIAPYVARLRARGKPYKCAIVAAMRKLLIHIQSLLKANQILLAS